MHRAYESVNIHVYRIAVIVTKINTSSWGNHLRNNARIKK